MDSRVHVKLQISAKESKEIVTQVTVTDKNPSATSFGGELIS
jgi:hypothetical protein